MSYSVAVAGASGYAGGEILRLLAGHPEFVVKTATANSNAGRPLIELQPHLRSYAGLVLADTSPETLASHDVVFLALPHGASGEITDVLEKLPGAAEMLIIDCGADHRLESADDWAKFYGGLHAEQWTYGVPELINGSAKLRASIIGAKRIAAPGCNASAVALSIAPGVASGVIEADDIVSVLAVGPSGAGRVLKTHLLASELIGSASAYAVAGTHRHIPEILQALRWAGATNPSISFTPVLVPASRGILATTTAKLVPGVSKAQVRQAWIDAYEDEPYVKILPDGHFPRTADVLGANTALIGVAIDEAADRVVVVTAIDNLVKGTAGAAIQSANIALGVSEMAGLPINGVAP